jgi:hypothetical protein
MYRRIKVILAILARVDARMPTATRRGRQLYSVAKTMALTAVGIDDSTMKT